MLTYSRDFLYCLRKQPIVHDVARRCKEAGIFRYRGRRSGKRYKPKLAPTDAAMVKSTNRKPGLGKPVKTAVGTGVLCTLLLINARSLRNKVDELEWTLDIHKTSIAAITETWMTQEMPDNIICPLNYRIFRTDRRNKNGGGVCVLAHENWTTHVINHRIVPPSFVEVIAVYAKLPTMPREISGLVVVVLYIPPGMSRPQIKSIHEMLALMVDVTRVKYPSAKTIILGDFNQIPISAILQSTGLKQIVNFPTRNQKTLDLVLTDLGDQSTVEPLPPLGTSDHSVVKMCTKLRIHRASDPKVKVIRTRPKPEHAVRECGVRLATFDWSTFKEIPTIEEKYRRFKEYVTDIFHDHFPEKLIRIYPRSKPWYNYRIARLIDERDQALRKGDKYEYTRLRRQVESSIREAKEQYYNQSIADSRFSNPWRWHQKIKEHAAVRKPGIPSVEIDTDTLNKHFVSYGVQRTSDAIQLKPSDRDNPTTLQDFEVGEMLRKIDLRKSQPLNDCPAFMLRQFWVELAEPVAAMFNQSLSEAVLPDEWRSIEIVPIPKVKNPVSPNDFRPIGLIPVLMKVLEKYITYVVKRTKQQATNPNQYGGQTGLSTTHYLVSLLEFLHQAADKLWPARLIAVDVAKAYNSVNHDVLSVMIDQLCLHPQIENWIRTFIWTMQQRVCSRSTNSMSGPLPLRAGVPQGTALAGEIFLIYINDCPIEHLMWLFIDDMTAGDSQESYLHTSGSVQAKLDCIDEWLTSKKLTANANKSATLTVDFRKNPLTSTNIIPLKLAGDEIPQVPLIKILGIYIQEDLKFDHQIEAMLCKARTKLYLLRRLANLGVKTTDLRLVYMTYILPLLEYAAPAWSAALTNAQSDQLELIQKRACTIMNKKWSNKYEDNLIELGLDPLAERREKSTLALAWKMYNHPHFHSLFPPTCRDLEGPETRNSHKLQTQRYRTGRSNSPIPTFVKLLNQSGLI